MQKIIIPAVSVVLAGVIAFVVASARPADERTQVPSVPAKAALISEIGAHADNIPPPVAIARSPVENREVVVRLRATQTIAELDDGTTYEYWTYNDQVPGPFIRAMAGDTVEVHLSHEHAHGALEDSGNAPALSFILDSFVPIVSANGDDPAHDHGGAAHEEAPDEEAQAHMAAGHGEHSIDLHAVIGPGGGAEVMRVPPNESKSFRFRATRPGIYIYHCASPHVPTHIANGMYGMILVEPEGGLPLVDNEFYVMQGEFYTTGKVGEKGHQEFDLEKLLMEHPEYVVFNGRVGSLTGTRALRAEVGESIRIFFGVSGQLASNFHIIGEIFDDLYPEGDIISPPRKNVQTTLVPGGGAAMVEFTAEVPGTYLLVDHALGRAINRGAVGQLVVESPVE